MYRELVDRLREHAEWAAANEWETPITLGDDLAQAADAIERLLAELARVKHEREEQSKDCEYCRTVYAKGDWADGGAHDFRLDKGVLYYHDAQFGWEGIRVNNCPMCGRRLKEVDN